MHVIGQYNLGANKISSTYFTSECWSLLYVIFFHWYYNSKPTQSQKEKHTNIKGRLISYWTCLVNDNLLVGQDGDSVWTRLMRKCPFKLLWNLLNWIIHAKSQVMWNVQVKESISNLNWVCVWMTGFLSYLANNDSWKMLL